ncbi:unnamed protein product [Schistocephalus solidus]|uniref:Uncharacterized protein n=1 Tax=Schistocephalus solidus TaxID=70667 RepID=A0A183SUW4_SCHSO|nr:unnamed protein product [Schistocephalus solidus]
MCQRTPSKDTFYCMAIQPTQEYLSSSKKLVCVSAGYMDVPRLLEYHHPFSRVGFLHEHLLDYVLVLGGDQHKVLEIKAICFGKQTSDAQPPPPPPLTTSILTATTPTKIAKKTATHFTLTSDENALDALTTTIISATVPTTSNVESIPTWQH